MNIMQLMTAGVYFVTLVIALSTVIWYTLNYRKDSYKDLKSYDLSMIIIFSLYSLIAFFGFLSVLYA